MIPILYDTNEVAFISNGLGRLRDCVSCTVTEERNGIYECDFEYPMDGANFDRIKVGRIIGVTHDEDGDIQPFDIVSYSRPINGVVAFHCTHISYRQSYLTVTGSNINSLADAFSLFASAEPSNPFTYQTDRTSSAYMAAADGLPHTVRSMLGGMEGSVLDAYGGEYEWDKWNVILHQSRGVLRNFSIRYGVNMLDYNEEYDISSTYSSCIPYWTDGTNTVVGNRVDSTSLTVTGRGECVPLDLSDKFETQPTQAALETEAASYMMSQNPSIATQNIHVEFVRLQDMGYEGLDNLLSCRLCDTINVIFPDYDGSGAFKIVKTVWNVLEDKYESMELGDLSITLAEALGISNSNEKKAEEADYVTVTGTSGDWHYQKWNSGKVEAWGSASTGTLSLSASGDLYRATGISIAIPSGIFSHTPTAVYASAHYSNAAFVTASASPTSSTELTAQVWKSTNNTTAVTLRFYAVYFPSDY